MNPERQRIMKHDFRAEPSGAAADQFRSWLERETIDCLRRSLGDGEGTKTAIFLFVNRAYEAHLPEAEIGAMFGKCFVRAGSPEADEESAFALLEFLGEIAAKVHA
jgi:hypothetical protein